MSEDEKMNEEEKKEVVSKLTEEHKNTLKQWASEADTELDDLVSDFCELFAKEEAKEAYGDDDDARISYAMNAVRARVGNEMATPTEEVEMYILGISPSRTIERDDGSTNKVGSVFGVGAVESFDGLKVIDATAWGDEAEKVDQLEYGEAVKMNLSRQSSVSKEKVSYNFESHTEVEKGIDFDPSNVPKLLEEFFPKVEVARVREHESTSMDDYKLVRGIIEDINFLSKDDEGRQMVRVEMMDNSVSLKDVSETGLFSVMMPADMCRFGPDSDVCFIGRINISDEYGPGMFATGVAPVLGYEYEKDLSEVEEEDLTMEDAEDTVASDAVASDEKSYDDDQLI